MGLSGCLGCSSELLVDGASLGSTSAVGEALPKPFLELLEDFLLPFRDVACKIPPRTLTHDDGL